MVSTNRRLAASPLPGATLRMVGYFQCNVPRCHAMARGSSNTSTRLPILQCLSGWFSWYIAIRNTWPVAVMRSPCAVDVGVGGRVGQHREHRLWRGPHRRGRGGALGFHTSETARRGANPSPHATTAVSDRTGAAVGVNRRWPPTPRQGRNRSGVPTLAKRDAIPRDRAGGDAGRAYGPRHFRVTNPGFACTVACRVRASRSRLPPG
jgi:hypothetical protein